MLRCECDFYFSVVSIFCFQLVIKYIFVTNIYFTRETDLCEVLFVSLSALLWVRASVSESINLKLFGLLFFDGLM